MIEVNDKRRDSGLTERMHIIIRMKVTGSECISMSHTRVTYLIKFRLSLQNIIACVHKYRSQNMALLRYYRCCCWKIIFREKICPFRNYQFKFPRQQADEQGRERKERMYIVLQFPLFLGICIWRDGNEKGLISDMLIRATHFFPRLIS